MIILSKSITNCEKLPSKQDYRNAKLDEVKNSLNKKFAGNINNHCNVGLTTKVTPLQGSHVQILNSTGFLFNVNNSNYFVGHDGIYQFNSSNLDVNLEKEIDIGGPIQLVQVDCDH